MSKSDNQKLKILYIRDYLEKNSHEDHPVRASELIYMLEHDHNILCERKTIYSDIEALKDFGMDIVSIPGKNGGYYLASRNFELPEVKLLINAVQSSRYLTEKKSKELIEKLCDQCSIQDAGLVRRDVRVSGRVKSMNESIYYNVDEIHRGIAENRKIRFHYFEYSVQKERRFRRDGAWYVISPYALSWDDENYYLVGYDSEAGRIKHFRVDKMADIGITEQERDGGDSYAAMDMAVYARKTFGMFTGEETQVKLRFENDIVGAVLDRLGRDIMLIPDGPEHFTVRTDIVVSPQFFAWIFGFSGRAKIISPEPVARAMEEQLKKVLENL